MRVVHLFFATKRQSRSSGFAGERKRAYPPSVVARRAERRGREDVASVESKAMITLPRLAADELGFFLASQMRRAFGSSHARLTEVIPLAARLALDCIGNSDALYHDVEHTLLT